MIDASTAEILRRVAPTPVPAYPASAMLSLFNMWMQSMQHRMQLILIKFRNYIGGKRKWLNIQQMLYKQ